VNTVTIEKQVVRDWVKNGRLEAAEAKKDGRRYGGWNFGHVKTMIERANRGAALLDEREPGWNFKVAPEDLDMADATLCIVGQTYGSYNRYVGPVFGRPEYVENDEVMTQAVEHGFVTDIDEDDPDDVPWELMDLVWSYLLIARAQSGQPVMLALPEFQTMRKKREVALATA